MCQKKRLNFVVQCYLFKIQVCRNASSPYLFPSINFELVILTCTVIHNACPGEFVYHQQLKFHWLPYWSHKAKFKKKEKTI